MGRIVVVGAGRSGLGAAEHLARAGREVVLTDSRLEPDPQAAAQVRAMLTSNAFNGEPARVMTWRCAPPARAPAGGSVAEPENSAWQLATRARPPSITTARGERESLRSALPLTCRARGTPAGLLSGWPFPRW